MKLGIRNTIVIQKSGWHFFMKYFVRMSRVVCDKFVPT